MQDISAACACRCCIGADELIKLHVDAMGPDRQGWYFFDGSPHSCSCPTDTMLIYTLVTIGHVIWHASPVSREPTGELTRPATMLSHSKGLLNRKAVRTPESGSGQSFICRASICAATTAVGGSMGVGALCSSGPLLPL